MQMNSNTVLILGGYGGIGRPLARLLLEETPVDLVIAGRNAKRAEEVAVGLRRDFPGRAVTSRYADASNQESLLDAFQGVRFVVVTTTTPALVKQIASAALACGSDYLDTMVNESTMRDLGELASPIGDQGRVFITQAGFHPGLPAVLVRQGARYFDVYEKAIVGMAMNARLERPEQAEEIIAMVTDFDADICKDGTWRKATFRDGATMDMGKRFGTAKLLPMQLVEMKRVQELFDLKEAGVYVSGFNWVTDNLVFPVIYVIQRTKKGLAKGFCLKLFTWSVNTFSAPDQGVVLINNAEGRKDGKTRRVRIVVEHDDAYLFTVIPIVACLKQYLDGALGPGLSMMGHVVDDDRLIRDMEQMGVKTRVELVEAQGG